MKRNRHRTIQTVSDLIVSLGGTAVVADWLDVGPSAVSNMKRENYIPPGWHLNFYLEIQARGLDVDLERIFGRRRPLEVRRRRKADVELSAA
jgi:hypothetical protein